MDEREREDGEVPAARQVAEEPEPDWAEQIRALRKQRGDRLRTLLGAHDDDGRTDT